jgi:hypothetical protein
LTLTDVVLPGNAIDLRIQRTYNSKFVADWATPWRFTYNTDPSAELWYELIRLQSPSGETEA